MTYPRQRFRRSTWKTFVTLLILALLVASRLWEESSESPPVPVESSVGRVQRVVDGDTLLMDGGVRVRLLGVDTPETKKPDHPVEPFGPEASEFTARLVEGKTVRLEYDRERFDQHGRTLAYVYVDGKLLNEEIILAGFSTAQTQYPYRSDMKRRFREAEQQARQQRVGIWSTPRLH